MMQHKRFELLTWTTQIPHAAYYADTLDCIPDNFLRY